MASLIETQTPLLERDSRCGLVPPHLHKETELDYHRRLAVLYHLRVEDVIQIISSGAAA